MPFPLMTVGAAKTATGVKLFTPVHNTVIAIDSALQWNPKESSRWSLEAPGVVLWRQLYGTERESSTSPQWGQHWPRK